MTNVMATLIVCIVTNTYAPKQYKVTQHYLTFPAQTEEKWVDWPWYLSPSGPFGGEIVRDNPDKQITEIREIRKWRFSLDGVPDHVISDRILQRIERRRVVTTTETWEEREVPVEKYVLTNALGTACAVTMATTNSINARQ